MVTVKQKSTGIAWFSEEDIECLEIILLITVLQLDVPDTKNQNSMLYKQLRAYIYKSQMRQQIKDTNSPKGTDRQMSC
jgi:hypothetical protein